MAAVRDGRINIVPKTWEKTFFNWMENIQPWCVSRQLWWGHRIPAWYGPKKTDDRKTLLTISIPSTYGASPSLTGRSEEHTSELQSLMRISYAVFCLKKKTN